jgi:uncharacterized protein (TIGR00661 family)
MRILYGVFGYGRGHATRAMSVLSALAADHELLVCAGGDAFDALSSEMPVRPIPTLRYEYVGDGRRSRWRTIARNAPRVIDLLAGGPAFTGLCSDVRAFAPELAICDAEPWTHRAAARLGVPRIGFDHFGVLAYCRPSVGPADRLELAGDVLAYRALIGSPDRVIVSSFYDAPASRTGVRRIGPLIRDEVRAANPTRGDHLLVYFNNGAHQLTARVLATLDGCGLPVTVYGSGRVGRSGRIEFKAPANRGFVEDLASCRAVLSTAGNQLVGETLHLGKPILVVPEETLEQRVNAAAVQRLGIGEALTSEQLSAAAIARFLGNEARYREATRRHARDGRAEALDTLDELARELTGRGLGGAGALRRAA